MNIANIENKILKRASILRPLIDSDNEKQEIMVMISHSKLDRYNYFHTAELDLLRAVKRFFY